MTDQQLMFLIVLVAVVFYLANHKKYRPSRTAFGKARWTSDRKLAKLGFFGKRGLLLGRTLGGKVIRIPRYCHILLVGGSGSGKGVSVILPILLSHFRGAMVVWDLKGDHFLISGKVRNQAGHQIYRFAPFDGGTDCINICDVIPVGCPRTLDSARAMAVAMAYVEEGSREEGHWRDRAVMVITALLYLVLINFEGEARSLNTLAKMAADPPTILGVAATLEGKGGVAQLLGLQLKTLFEKNGSLTKEGSSVLACLSKYLAFLASEPVEAAVSKSTFDIKKALRSRSTLYLQVGSNNLKAMEPLLRCITSTLIRVGMEVGNEKFETFYCFDEASALNDLPAVEEALVRGRSSGARILGAYQSDSQVQNAFHEKKSLWYDNASVQIYLSVSGYETAERLSKMLGDFTEVRESFTQNSGVSWQQGGKEHDKGQNVSRGSSTSLSVGGRSLLRPEEILGLERSRFIAFVDGAPILGRRLLYYSDPLFKKAGSRMWWLLVLGVIGILWLVFGG